MVTMIDQTVLWVSIFSVVILVGQLASILRLYLRSGDLIRQFIISYAILFAGILTLPLGVIVAVLIRVEIIETNLTNRSISVIAYALYFILILIGNNLLFIRVIKIPDKNYMMKFNRRMMVVYILTIIAIARNLGFLGDTLTYSQVEEGSLFVVLTIGAILFFSFLLKWLRQEITQTPSKLVQLRLTLTRYFIFVQISVIILTFGLSVILILIQLQNPPESTLAIYRLFFNTAYIITALGSGSILLIAVYLPNFVRRRYGLGSERYDAVVRLGSYFEEDEP